MNFAEPEKLIAAMGRSYNECVAARRTKPITVHIIERQLQQFLLQHPCLGQRWLGFSGGLDSTVLLHACAQLQLPVSALHIHHGLSPNADSWAEHCRTQAAQRDIPFTLIHVKPRGDGGPEQAAREARYRVFTKIVSPGDQLLLAHHADDQVETFLLRLLRGAGVLGLGAMREMRPLGAGQLLRPLLGFSRVQLEEYAGAQQLQWIEDESNEDERFERNYLRSRVTPLLQSRWPLRERVARASANLQEAAELLQELGEQDLRRADLRRERFGGSVDLDTLLQLSVSRQKNLLRSWLGSSGGDMPQAVHLQQALDQLATAAEDSQLAVKLGGLVLRRFRNRAYLTPELPAARFDEDWHWDGSEALPLPDGWELGPSADWPQGQYRVCLRNGGERAQPAGRRHSQTLKKLLQELDLEPWLRDRVPLIYRGEELLAVGDLFVCGPGGMELQAPPQWRYRGIHVAFSSNGN